MGNVGSKPRLRNLDAQINELLGKFTIDLAVWNDLTASFQAELYCGIFLETWNSELGLKPATLRSLSDRGLELTFDIYESSVDLPNSETR